MEDAYGSTSRPTGLRSAKPVVPISDSPDSSCAHDHRCCCRLQVQKSWRPTPKQKRQDFHARSNSLRYRIDRLLVHRQPRDSRYGCCTSGDISAVRLGNRPLEDEEKISPPEAGSGHRRDRVIEPVPNVGSTLEVAMNGANERVQQKDKSLQSSASETTGMNRWTWLYLAVASAVFGYWQNNIAAGIFVFLFLVLLTRLLYMVVNTNRWCQSRGCSCRNIAFRTPGRPDWWMHWLQRLSMLVAHTAT